MPKDFISKKTRNEFREHLVGYYLAQIKEAFEIAGIECDTNYLPTTSGQRRSLVEQYYHSINWSKWDDVAKVLIVFEHVLIALQSRIAQANEGDKYAAAGYNELLTWLAKDGFVFQDGKLCLSGKNILIPEFRALISRFDLPELNRQIERMRAAVDEDPALAIGTAKELIETTCKSILHERTVPFDNTWDVVDLVKETRKVLKLLPDDIPENAKGADTIRKLLSNLGTIAQSVAELRNLYGTGHGRDGKAKGLRSRHARMVTGAAATLASFLLETHVERTE